MCHDPQLRGIARFLYTQNPFYLLSACLVLYGLRVGFEASSTDPANAWYLAGALGGYTLLMGLTAFLVIRWGRVWDDARSILMIIVLQLLAISVSFDELCRRSLDTAAPLLLVGLIFAVAVTEVLLRSLRIKLGGWFRGPYYGFLGLFFLYPILLALLAARGVDQSVAWLIFLFPVCCAVVLLFLIPAVRRGCQYVQHNGTPWRWPLFPWSLFVVLLRGVCLRSYVLSLSFDPWPERELSSTFGLYHLAPVLMAVIVLILEVGIVERLRGFQALAMWAAPSVVLVSLPEGNGAAFERFLEMLVHSIGSPLWLALFCVMAFYAYTWKRRVPGSETAFHLALLALCFVGQGTTGSSAIAVNTGWPLVLFGTIQLVQYLRQRNSLRLFAAIAATVLLFAVGLWQPQYTFQIVVLAYHLLMATAFAVGYCCEDQYARGLRALAGGMTLLATGIAFASSMGPYDEAAWQSVPAVPMALRTGYVLVLALVTLECWQVLKDRFWLLASLLHAGVGVYFAILMTGEAAYEVIGPRGFLPLVGGLACFLVAGLISAQKCGLLTRLVSELSALVHISDVAKGADMASKH